MRKTVCKKLRKAVTGWPKIKQGTRPATRYIRPSGKTDEAGKILWDVLTGEQILFINHYRNAKRGYRGDISKAVEFAENRAIQIASLKN